MYYGEVHTTLDPKGRFMPPKDFRTVMDALDHEVWYMTRGFDGAIFLFPQEQWKALRGQLGQSNPLDPRMLDFRRLFLGSIAKVKRDGQSRLSVPAPLREYAEISKEIVLLGVEDHLEIWSHDTWRAYQKDQAVQYKAMAEELFSVASAETATTGEDVRDA